MKLGGDSMKQKNIDIREKIKASNLKYYEIAFNLGLNDGNFSRLLRRELSREQKNEIFKIIEKLKEEKENGEL